MAENEDDLQRCVNPSRQRVFPRINILEERQLLPEIDSSSENEDASDTSQEVELGMVTARLSND